MARSSSCWPTAGEPWTTDIVPKKNGPNLLYVNEEDRLAMEPEYQRLEAYLDLDRK